MWPTTNISAITTSDQNCRDWFDYSVIIGLPLMTCTIAVFVAYISYRQWQTNQDKLRLDLYNRRFEIYVNTITFFQFLSSVQTNGITEDFRKAQRAFIRSCRESQFLFSDESKVFAMLEKIHSDSFKIIGLKEHGDDITKAGSHEVSQKMVLAANTAFTEIDTSIIKLESAMSPYLKFHGNAT